MEYTGYKEVQLGDEELAKFYQGDGGFVWNLVENQYLLIKDKDGKIVDKYCYQDGKLERVKYLTFNSMHCGLIKPRNDYQELAFAMLMNRKTPIKVLTGTYGSGKDLCMTAASISLIEQNKFDKIIYIRPNVSLGGVPEIGYLKGSVDEKLGWTLAPLWDKFGGEEAVNILQQQGHLELVPLPFIRGRSFDNSIIYVSEGQNITKEVAAVLISRIGENSEIWINSDFHQSDRKLYDNNNGIAAMINAFKGNELFEMVNLPITERSAAARMAAILMGD